MPEKVNNEMARLARELSRAASEWAKAFEPIRVVWEDLREFAHAIREPLHEARRSIEEMLAPIERELDAFQQQVGSIVAEVKRALADLPQRNQEALRILAQNGWYPDPDLPPSALFQLATLFESNEGTQANTQLCGYFDSCSKEIEATLCNQFPSRAKLLHSAFAAHRRGEYNLAIPVLLAQADGVCQEVTGIQLYQRRDGVPRLASELGLRDAIPLLASLLTPLIEPMPISAGANERVGLPDALNRHAVLHGESVDYGSQINSCRAISLLVYVSWVLRER